MSRFYLRDGSPCTLFEWAERFEHDLDYKIVRQDEVNGVRVSTVWLGIDHQFGNGPPLIFETMTFRGTHALGDQERYSTEAQAIEGHRRMVELVACRHGEAHQ